MSLSNLFYPKSVALIGASREEGAVGNEIAKNLTKSGYGGKVYLVNPKGGRLYGKKLIRDLGQVNSPLDLAIIAIPAQFVLEEVKKLAQKKAKSLIIISAGFREKGNIKEEEEIAKICSDTDISLLGPNCLGLINAHIKLNASFAPLMPKVGEIAFISQSGALCASVLDLAAKSNLGFSKFVSVGNKAQIGEVELLDYFHHDPKTKVIAIYMEELDEARIFKEIVPRITNGKPKKPIIVLKAGRTQEGKKAAMSHTGSLGGSDSAYESLFTQTGIIRTQTIEELFEIVECFTRNEPLKNNRVAVITNAGGPGVLTADELVLDDLKLASLSDLTNEKLNKVLPAAASIKNPIDILGDADAARYRDTLKIVLEDKNVDAVQIILTPQSMTEVKETAKVIVALKKQNKKPIITTFIGDKLTQEGTQILNQNEVATSTFPENAAKALKALNLFRLISVDSSQKEIRFSDVNPKIVREILNANSIQTDNLLPMQSAFEILNAYRITTLKRFAVKTDEEAQKLSQKLQGELALRIISPDINHKSDVGGVVLSVDSKNLKEEVSNLLKTVHKNAPKAKLLGVDVSSMQTEPGIELILGANTDPKLGKQIMVGLGGVYAEVIKDISWGLAPLKKADIARMIANLKINKILSGYRGHPPLDVQKTADCIARLSQLVSDFPQIKEIDINPLKVLDAGKGVVALDARIALSSI